MVTGQKNVFNCAANFLRGRKCIFCGSFKVCKTARGYVRCRHRACERQKSLKQLRKEIAVLTGFYQQQPAYRLASDIGMDYQAVTRVYQRLREAIYHVAELEAGKLKGEIEIDEAYFGGRRKGKRGRGAAGKSIVFGLLERDGRVYTKVVERVTADELMAHIRKHTRKGSVYYTDTFRSYNSLKCWGKHHRLNHGKAFAYRGKITLMALKAFRAMRSISCTIIEGFPNITSRCILKRWSIDSTIGMRIYLSSSS